MNNTDDQLRPGDRVFVIDHGLEALRDVMRRATGEEPPPNHHGTVDRVYPAEHGVREEDSVLITFDDGGAAPYPISEVRPLVGGEGTMSESTE